MDAPSQDLLKHWPGAFFRQKSDLSFESVSPYILELSGRHAEEWELDPEIWRQTVHESDADLTGQQVQRAATHADGVECVIRFRHAQSGRVAYVHEYRRALRDRKGNVIGFEGFWTDVTRLTLAERRLVAAAWKETLGLITLGLAHDFNNVLAGTLALSESFLAQIPADHPFREGLELIKQNTEHAAQLIRRIAQLHRGKVGNLAYHDLNELVSDSVELLRKVIPKRIEVHSEVASSQLPVYIDPVEAQQVLINLALNGADAMQERGILVVKTSAHQELPELGFFTGARPRTPAVCLSVSDNGTGIKARHLQSIFDPFFTTKPMNKGSGLGLYNARLFADKHGGAISVESKEGHGTTFRVWLPQADFTEADRAQEFLDQRRRSVLLAGRPGNLLESTAEFLRQNGLHVVVAGLNAEELLRSSDYNLDAILVVAEPHDAACLRLAAFVRQQKLPLKVIIKTIGCNQDELDTQFLVKADLVISADVPQETILEKLLATLKSSRP